MAFTRDELGAIVESGLAQLAQGARRRVADDRLDELEHARQQQVEAEDDPDREQGDVGLPYGTYNVCANNSAATGAMVPAAMLRAETPARPSDARSSPAAVSSL